MNLVDVTKLALKYNLSVRDIHQRSSFMGDTYSDLNVSLVKD